MRVPECLSNVNGHVVVAAALFLSLLSLTIAPGPVVAGGDGPLRRAAFVGKPYWESDVVGLVREMATADLDGDGQLEILVGTEAGELRVLGADGTLAWLYQTRVPVLAISVADLDLDSQPEVLVGDSLGTLLVLRGETSLPEGEDRELWSYPSEGAVGDVVVADLTGDGLGEILIGADDLHVYALNDDGDLLWRFPTGSSITSLSTADVDNDGLSEALVSTLDGYAYAFNGAGEFKWQFEAADGITAMAAADLNNDGTVEVLIGSPEGMTYVMDLTASLWKYSTDGAVQSLDTGDLDGDGRSEVVVGWSQGVSVLDSGGQLLWQHPTQGSLLQASVVGTEIGSPAILIQDDAGAAILRQSDEVVEEVRLRGGGLQGPAVFSDVNGDGFGEVVVAADRYVRLFGYSARDLESDLRWTFAAGGPVSTANFGDVDGDGLPEIVVGSLDWNVYVLREGKAVVPALATAGAVNVVRLADLDGDGVDEILAGSTDGKAYASSWARGMLWQRPTGGEVTSLAVANLDGDRVPEVLAGSGDANVYVLGADDGAVIWQFPTGGPVSALATGDLNGDGRPEVLVGSADSRVYALASADDVIWVDELSNAVTTVSVADLEGDGHLEVLAASFDGRLYALKGEDGTPLWQQPAGRVNSLATADVDGDGWLEVLVGSSDGNVYLLRSQPDRPDRVMWKFDAGDLIRSVAAADVDGDDLPEVLAGARDGKVYVLQGGTGDKVNEYVIGGDVRRMGGVDVDGDGLSEIAAASSDGSVYLFGRTLNQTPLLVDATYERAEAGWVYSVDANDPEGDQTNVWLEVLDPVRPFWERGLPWQPYEPQFYAEPGEFRRLDWVANPFDWWDGGRETQFRFRFGDGGQESTLPAVRGPKVPGLPWPVKAVLWLPLPFALVGAYVVIQRRQRWAKSPAGQASLLYDRIARNPRRLLAEIRGVVAESEDTAQVAQILSELHVLYGRREGQSAQADVAQGHALMLRSPDLLVGGLRTLISGLSELEGVEGQDEALAVYELLHAGLDANSVSRIAALRTPIEFVRPMAKASVLGPPGLGKVLEFWLQIAASVQSYEKVQAADDKIRYLGRTVESLGRLERDIGRTFAEPERSLLGEIAGRWLTAVNNALSEMRGRAELKIALKTRQVLDIGDISLVLELRNEGKAPAENVTVELLPSKQYEVLEGVKIIPSLPAGWSDSAEVRLLPRVEGSFRAVFRVTYDDEEREGKALPFADEISLMEAEEEFQWIVNPYYAGRPLETGSSLFVGRQDVFDFIQQNISGRFQDNVLVLIGQRRTGKTSLLKQLPVRLGEHYVPVYIDGQQLGVDPGMVNLFYGLSRIIARGLSERGIRVTLPSRADFEPAPAEVFEEQFLAEVQEALGDRRLVLSFDEFEELEARVRDDKLDRTIFPFLRHLMQHSEKLAFIFVGTHKLEELTRDYWSIFFNIALYRDIRFLDETAARWLIIEPVKEYGMIYDDLAVHRILETTACHPHFLQLMCHALVNFHNASQRNYITAQDVRDAIDDIIALGEAHYAFIWANASAEERLVLAALTPLLAEETMVTSSDVANKLAEYGQKMDPTDVSATLSGLAAQDIVQEIPDHSLRYNFKLDLIRRWIERFKHLSAVVEEVT